MFGDKIDETQKICTSPRKCKFLQPKSWPGKCIYIWQVFWGGKNLEECQDWNYPRLPYQSLSEVYLSFYLSIYLTVSIWLLGVKNWGSLFLNYFDRFLCCPCYGFSVVVVSTIFVESSQVLRWTPMVLDITWVTWRQTAATHKLWG